MPENTNKNLPYFSVIIPAHNEEGNIINTIKETLKVFKEFNKNFEIIIVDDGSLDNTFALVKEFLETVSEKIRIETYKPNKGKGYALKYGTSFANGRLILFLDADLDLHPAMVKEMYSIMCQKSADVVIGSKMHKKSVINYPFLRRLASYAYYIIIKILFRLKIKDTQTGIKLFKKDALLECLSKVVVERYASDLELCVALNKRGYKIVEAPVKVEIKRQFGRLGIKDAFKVFSDTLGVFNRLYFKKYYN